MPLVLPYRGVRLDARSGDLAARLCPPYDVVDETERARLAAHAENLVHLELPLDERGPGSRYAVAAERLAAWMRGGVLRRDDEPALYAYAQRFRWNGETRERRGVFGLLELAAPGAESRLHPHETTLAAPREDRRRLLEATGANTSPIFLLADDPDGVIAGALAAAVEAPPLASAGTPWGTEERLWRWTGDGARRAAAALAECHLVFADGHHRFASAREHARTTPEESARFVLAAVTPMHDAGLLVLPTHRLLPAATAAHPAVQRLFAEHFDAVPLATPAAAEAGAGAALAWLEEAERAGHLALVLAEPGVPRGLTLRPDRAAALFAESGVDERLWRLAVSALQAVLARALGVPAEEAAARAGFAYTHDAADALARAERGGGVAALVPPTPVADVVRIASAGLLLPQKSTYFLPKLTTGWLLHVHDRAGEEWRGSTWGRARQAVAHEWLGRGGVIAEAAG